MIRVWLKVLVERTKIESTTDKWLSSVPPIRFIDIVLAPSSIVVNRWRSHELAPFVRQNPMSISVNSDQGVSFPWRMGACRFSWSAKAAWQLFRKLEINSRGAVKFDKFTKLLFVCHVAAINGC